MALAHLTVLVARHRIMSWFGVDCVAESVAIESQLRRRGQRPSFRLGMSVNDSAAAHAWVEIDGEPVNAGADIHDRFVAFDGPLPGDSDA